jgi:hypothetical protein
MSRAVATCLERMRGAARSPMVLLVVMRDGRTPAYAFDVTEETELDDLAARVGAMCSNAGFTKFELHALDRDGRTVGTEKIDWSAPRKAARRRDGDSAIDVARVQAVIETSRLLGQVLAALLAENATLLEERRELRRMLAERKSTRNPASE